MANRYRSLEERFWGRVHKTDGCWLWTGGQMHFGYGGISVKGRNVRAHRVSWELHNGPIPDGMWVLHRCDNPPCVNPAHLFLGDNALNTADRDRKGRQRSLRGDEHWAHRLTREQVAEIRQRPYEPYREIAERLGVHSNTIHRIRRGELWAASEPK